MSNIRSLKKMSFDSVDTAKLQDNLEQWTESIIRKPILNGLILEKISLSTGSNDIPHRLGRKLIGWQIIRQRSAASIFD